MIAYSPDRVLATAIGRWGKRSLKTRVFEKVFIDFETGCWNWSAATRAGYGQFRDAGATQLAHRMVWRLYNGPLNPELVLDHLCRNTRCVNPEHLEQVTSGENSRRMHEAAGSYNTFKTHCPANHAYAGNNLLVSPDGKRRSCRECGRKAAREYARRKRAGAKS